VAKVDFGFETLTVKEGIELLSHVEGASTPRQSPEQP